MASIRTERIPVRTYGLGIFGLDHLQLVYQQDESGAGALQDQWFVMEGLRETAPGGTRLSVEGWEGSTTLSQANGGLAGEELVARIGTPETRGSRPVPLSSGEVNAWATMASFAGDIEAQGFPYIAFSLAASPIPTINSSSLVSSLLYYIGVDISSVMPFGARLSPGTTTLIGSSENDDLGIVESFTTIVAGEGNDTLRGSDDPDRIDKLYGGRDDDRLEWSEGFNILHGGETQLAYEKDGIDTVDYVGAGVVHIDANPYPVPHYRPDFIATRESGLDHLYSIERLEWDEASDHIVLGEGVSLVEEEITLKLGLQNSAGEGDRIDFSPASDGLLINAAGTDLHVAKSEAGPETGKGIWIESAEWIIGSAGNDRIYPSPSVRGVEGGGGSDLIDARFGLPFAGASPRGYDIEIDGGAGDDTIVAGAGRTAARGGDGADRFVLSSMTFGTELVEFVIEDASAEDRVYAPYDFFNLTFADAEGSPLFPLLGALAQESGHAAFADLPESLGPWLGGPPGRSDFFAFEWQLEEDRHFGSDQTDGLITFAGMILYNREGSDLLIHLFLGIPQEVTELGSDELPWTHVVNVYLPGTEAVIRVEDFEEGDLGIVFHDPGEPEPIDIETDHGPYGAVHYPGWDAAVHAITNDGILVPAIEPRPDPPVHDPGDDGPGDNQNVVRGSDGDDVIVLAESVDATIEAGAGNDTVEAAGGDDIIDGGSGDDTMTGGAGDDIYVVDAPPDVIVEAEYGGIDEVRSSVSFVLPDFVEQLTLVGSTGEVASILASSSTVTATGNALRNRLVGSGGDDTLRGLGGNDTLYGGGGSDTLDGGEGSDGYVYLAGDGDDVITDFGPAADLDTLVLGAIAPSDVFFHRLLDAPDDLVLTFSVGGRVLFQGFGSALGADIDGITFDDGTVWDRARVEALGLASPILSGDPPQAHDDFDLVVQGNNVLIPWEALTANDRDFDGDPLAIVAVEGVTAGASVSIEPGNSLRLLTVPGFEGLVSFAYRISDGAGGTATATAEIVVFPAAAANNAPVAKDDAGFETTIGVPLEILATELTGNDEDADGDALEIVTVAGGEHGTAEHLPEGTVLFTPEPGYSGSASFSYTVTDGHGGSSSAHVAVLIAAPAANVIVGTSADEVLTGTRQADVFDGRGGDDALIGRSGDDVFRVNGENAGFDTYKGGGGLDRIVGSARDDVIGIAGISGIEAIDGGEGFDIIRLTVGDDRIDLSRVEVTNIDLIDAGTGNDTVTGSAGADVILGGPGDDKHSALDGDDVFLVEGSESGFDVFKGGDGTDRIQGSAGDDVIGIAGLSGIEAIDGGDGFDILRLTEGSDKLDLFSILVTNVELIDGGAGNDRITSSLGDDVLVGGAGDDTFVFRPGLGHDVILDFETGDAGDPRKDVIDVRSLGYGRLAELLADAEQVGSDTLITVDDAASLRLADIALGQLRADDFRFA